MKDFFRRNQILETKYLKEQTNLIKTFFKKNDIKLYNYYLIFKIYFYLYLFYFIIFYYFFNITEINSWLFFFNFILISFIFEILHFIFNKIKCKISKINEIKKN